MKNDLYRLDNILIHSGLALLVLAMIVGLPLLRYELVMGSPLISTWPMLAFVAAPIVVLGAGIFVRQREARVAEIWRTVIANGEMPVASLCDMSGFTPTQLDKALRRINRRAASQLRWDEKGGKIIDTGRGPQDRLAHSAQCAGCGAPVAVNVTAHMDLGEVQCGYCSRAVDSEVINELQCQLLERASAQREIASGHGRGDGLVRFNLPMFVVLLVVFWPAAIAYAIWRSRAGGAST